MEWEQSVADGALVGHPLGRIDENSWEAFLAHMKEAIAAAADGRQSFVLDLAGVDYMSSRGLRVLTLARRDADAVGVAITLANPNPRMREILAISRYDMLFTIADSPGGPGR